MNIYDHTFQGSIKHNQPIKPRHSLNIKHKIDCKAELNWEGLQKEKKVSLQRHGKIISHNRGSHLLSCAEQLHGGPQESVGRSQRSKKKPSSFCTGLMSVEP